MRITVLIPVFNCEKYVGDAIESVFEQTRKIDEVIVINDGSTDRTASVLARFGDRINVIEQENRGGAAALNAGLNVATGELFTFLDADDVWMAEKTQLQLSRLLGDPSLDAVFGMVQQFTQVDGVPRAEIARHAQSPQRGISKITMMIRRASFERVGAFDASLRATEFAQWYMRATMLPLRSQMLDQVVAFRRLHDENTGRLMRAEQAQENLRSLRSMVVRKRERR